VTRWLDASLPDGRDDEIEALAARWEAGGGDGVRDDLEAFVSATPTGRRRGCGWRWRWSPADPGRAAG